MMTDRHKKSEAQRPIDPRHAFGPRIRRRPKVDVPRRAKQRHSFHGVV